MAVKKNELIIPEVGLGGRARTIACAGSFANDGSEVILATSLSLRKSAHPLPPCPSNRQ